VPSPFALLINYRDKDGIRKRFSKEVAVVYAWALVPTAVLAAVLGVLVTWLWHRSQQGVLRERLSSYERDVAELQPYRAESEALKVQLAELRTEREGDADKLQWIERAQQQMRDAFQALAAQSLQTNSTEILARTQEQLDSAFRQLHGDWEHQKTQIGSLVDPLAQSLQALDEEVRELERRREGAYQGVQTQLKQLADHNLSLQVTTATLAQALKSSSTRGRWGELQLHRVVDMAGMVKYVDFEEQVTTDKGRPDMIVHLPNGAVVPVDSKTPMNAYLEAIEAREDEAKASKLRDHVKALKGRIDELSKKAYWESFAGAADFVVMFVPNEASLSAAFDLEPGLLESAIGSRVLIATPVTLLALLKSAAFGWQQRLISENLQEIGAHGKEIYERLNIFAGHLSKTGERLNQAVDEYNKSVGSFRDRVVPTARRLRDCGLGAAELEAPVDIERKARPLQVD
jgi:DNA recombination protein RmuC